jgi:hypothetical protein
MPRQRASRAAAGGLGGCRHPKPNLAGPRFSAGFFTIGGTPCRSRCKPCAYDAAQKRLFHLTGRKRLAALAEALGFASGSYDLRSNAGGIAVSGEVTLHHTALYAQICQPATGADSGILIRTCQGRTNYTGGRNHFAPLSLLDDTPALAARCRAVLRSAGGRS